MNKSISHTSRKIKLQKGNKIQKSEVVINFDVLVTETPLD